MKNRIIGMLLLMVSGLITKGELLQKGFDKTRYYDVIANGNTEQINEELAVIRNSSDEHIEAYEGALLMKKAGLARGPEKIRLFKSGHSKLETSIKKDNDNAELRFLRIIIQEHAPKIVNYRGDLQKDAQLVQSSFKSLSPVVQRAIAEYSKQSKAISAKDL
jgi:hypothetical protein